MKKIQKVTMTTVLLVEAETPEAARAEIDALEPSEVMEEMDGGAYVGVTTIEKIEPLAADEVKAELEALGSDASFFGDEEDENPDHREE